MRPKLLLTFGVLAVVLVFLLDLEYRAEALTYTDLPPDAGHHILVQAAAPSDAATSSLDATHTRVETILQRPMFRSDRRPPAAGTVSAPAIADTLPRLSGILVSSIGKSLIFAASPGSKPIVVIEGGRIGRYFVQSIGAGQAIVVGPSGVRTLRPAFGEPVASGGSIQAVKSTPVQRSILDLLRNGPPSVGIPGLSLPGTNATLPGTPAFGTRH